MATTRMATRAVVGMLGQARALSSTSARRAVTEFAMPSMSPTMESGKISSWKLKEGDSFSAGDVLLTVETDKADIDVEAQDDGIMGKILFDETESSIKVGKIIALLAEEGDDISNLSAPESSKSESKSEEASSSSSSKQDTSPSSSSSSASSSSTSSKPESPKTHTPSSSSTETTASSQPFGHHAPSPKHSRAILPSVARILREAGITDVSEVKGTGKRGQLTKGDILAHLGKVKNSQGTASELEEWSRNQMDIFKKDHKISPSSGTPAGGAGAKGAEQKQPEKIMTGDEFRRWISSGLSASSSRSKVVKDLPPTPLPVLGFDDILEGYLPKLSPRSQVDDVAPTARLGKKDAWDELLSM